MRTIVFLMVLVAITWTLLDVVDSAGVPVKRVKRQYYGGYGYGGYGCGCSATYAPCPHGNYYGGYGGGYGGYGGYGGGYGYKK